MIVFEFENVTEHQIVFSHEVPINDIQLQICCCSERVDGGDSFLLLNILIKQFQQLFFQRLQILLLTMGKKIENYCLENVIGQGQFGKVYKAINEKNDQVVAIKVIKIEKFKMSPKLQEFTINQIQTLSKIQDTTHIVKFIEILKTANNYYFVYEFCNGGTLEQQIKQIGQFSEQKAISYFQQLLKAFRMLIKKNIMHRDVKPSNILLNNGILKLADFGFCKPLKDSRDLAQTMLGSPIYMAPQILKGEVYTMKADIWSLGVVLYEMLFGFCPFQQRTIARLINLIQQSSTITFPSNTQVSKRTQQLLKRILVKDQFKRISWEELFQYDFHKKQEEKVERNPFMKKQYNSIPLNDDYTKPIKLYSTKNDQQNIQPQSFKKTISNSTQKPINKSISPLLQKRASIKEGVKMVQQFLSNSSSKLTIYICCFIMKKVKQKSKQLHKSIEDMRGDKQNSGIQSKKVLNFLQEEKAKLEEKIIIFDEEMKSILEPQDIVFMRYAQEEALTQQRQGLLQLLKIDDYLHGNTSQYNKLTKKELLQQYEKRILRKY